MIYSKLIKSIFDRLMAMTLLIVLAPIFIVISLLLFFTQKGGIFFIQERTGWNMKRFLVYKYQTLVPSLNSSLDLSNREFTFAGKFLRRSGLDELPQLINIIKGEMSFIGPRPMPVEYESRYSHWHLKRFDVIPGITGWAQIHGKNNTSWRARFDYDCWYVDHISMWIDLRVLWMTIYQLIKSVAGQKEYDMPVFTGENLD